MTFSPTAAPHGDPSTCHACGRHAVSAGIGNAKEPRYLCTECLFILENIKAVRRMDPFELKALDGGVEAVGEYLGSINKTDLADCDELEARMLVKAAWLGCADRLRKVISTEVPF